LLGCHPIVAVDIVKSKLDVAKSMGATHVINSKTSTNELAEDIKAATGGEGTSITVDTTGNMKAIQGGFDGTATLGQFIFVGIASMDAKMELPLVPMLGVRILSSMQCVTVLTRNSMAKSFVEAVKAMSYLARHVGQVQSRMTNTDD